MRQLLLVLAVLAGVAFPPLRPARDTALAQERANPLIAQLENGRPAVGVWTGALAATRITRVLATADVDYIVADLEHDLLDFQGRSSRADSHVG